MQITIIISKIIPCLFLIVVNIWENLLFFNIYLSSSSIRIMDFTQQVRVFIYNIIENQMSIKT